MENFLLDFILSGFLFLVMLDIAFFKPLVIYYIQTVLIKGIILVNICGKCKKDFTNKEILSLYFKDVLKYKILMQAFMNLIAVYYSLFLDNRDIDDSYAFLICIFAILMIIISYKMLYKKYEKIFNSKKMCKLYSLLAMPDILVTLIYNFILSSTASSILYIT